MIPPPASRWLSSSLLFATLLLASAGPAEARSERVAAYTYERVWPATLRFLRIDEGLEIVEKDGEAGYVIFNLSDDGKSFRGTLEAVRFDDRGRPSVRLVINIEDRPSYMEQGMLDRLLQKLRAELGAPERPPAPAPKPPATEPPPAEE